MLAMKVHQSLHASDRCQLILLLLLLSVLHDDSVFVVTLYQ